MSNSTVAQTNETPSSGTVLAADDDYKNAEARTLLRHPQHWAAFADIKKSTIGDLLPLLFDSGETNDEDLAEAALHSIRQDLEVLCLAVNEMESYDIERALIKVQHQMTVVAELHRRSKAHRLATTEASTATGQVSS